jgi:carbon monoxide dehydrogenase subunit G
MVDTKHAVDVKRTPKEVWDFLMNPQNYRLWQGGLINIEASDGMNTGSQIVFTSTGLGSQFNLAAEVTANNGKDNFELVSVRGPLTFTSRYQLEEIAGGTRLHVENHIQTHGVFNLASSALQTIGDIRNKADLQQLKTVLEVQNQPAQK